MYWNEEIETISREELQKLQLERLKKSLEIAYTTPFYKTHFRKAGFKPSDLNTLDDIVKIPFTTKDDLRKAYPDGMLAVDKSKVIRMHASSGTTGTPTVVFHTKKDIDTWSDLMARSIYMAGIRNSDVFQNMMTYGLFTGGLGLHYGAERAGMMVIPASSGNTHRQIKLIQDFKVSVIHITPSYALHVADVLKNELNINASDLGIKYIIYGAEPTGDSTRKKIQELYKAQSFNCYGLSEMNGPGVGFECPYKTGLHIWEDNYYLEIINPETGEQVNDGETGELVLTTLMREGMPVIRYRTKDLTQVIVDKGCKCGRRHKRIKHIIGRSDDMMIVRGVNVFPSQIEHVLMRIPEVGTNYQIILDKDGHLDTMTVKVELYSKMFHGDLKELKAIQKKIEKELKDECMVSPKIILVEPGHLPPSMGKAVRVIDNRKMD